MAETVSASWYLGPLPWRNRNRYDPSALAGDPYVPRRIHGELGEYFFLFYDMKVACCSRMITEWLPIGAKLRMGGRDGCGQLSVSKGLG